MTNDEQSPKEHESTSQPSKDSTNSKRKEIRNALAATVELIGGKISGEALQMFVDELEPLPIQDVLKSLRRCRQEIKAEYGQTLTLKDVLDRAGIIPPGQLQSAAADLAWASVMNCFYQCADCPHQHLNSSNRDRLVEKGDPRLSHAIRAVGGWPRLIETDPKYQGPLRKEFIAAYSTFDAAQDFQLKELQGFSSKMLRDWNKMP